MTFNPNIPRANDLLAVSQGDLLTNNGALNTTFSRNHIPLNIGTNNGKHTFIEMPIRASIPNPVPGLINGEGTLYTKTQATQSHLFYTPDNSGEEFQMTPCLPLRAYVNFDGTGSNGVIPAGNIRSSYNVANVNKQGTGDYIINFTNATPTANYIVQGIGMRNVGDDICNVQIRGSGGGYGNSVTTTSVRIQTNGGTSSLQSPIAVMIMVWGG